MTGIQRTAIAGILGIHVMLLAWGAYRHSPCLDEVGHFAAGLVHWQSGRHDLYRVNPPLVRMVATLPLVLTYPRIDSQIWRPNFRPEFAIGESIIEKSGPELQLHYAIARWACVPFSLLGAVLCFQWARELFGTSAGFAALLMWCFNPNILAYAQMITPDIGATAFGLLAFYLFWHWLRSPGWWLAVAAGIAFGLALLCKATWIIIFVACPLMWLVGRWRDFKDGVRARRLIAQLCLIGGVVLLVLNVGYDFDGSCKTLGSYRFSSSALRAEEKSNRFRGSLLEGMPVPFPKHFVLGIDQQKADFERNKMSYMCGEWRNGGWYHYYVYGLCVKTPVGILALGLLAACNAFFRIRGLHQARDICLAVFPGLLVLVFVSSQTGLNRHLRYVAPALPFLFIAISSVFSQWPTRKRIYKILTVLLLTASVIESVVIYPHCLSFFNALVGGPRNGHLHLLDSNMDWGQDLYYLRDWLTEHPEVTDPWVATYTHRRPEHLGIRTAGPPPSEYSMFQGSDGATIGPLPGWYAVSVTYLRQDTRPDRENLAWAGAPLCGYLNAFEPTEMVGYSIYVYHLTAEQIAWVRADLGLRPLQDGLADAPEP